MRGTPNTKHFVGEPLTDRRDPREVEDHFAEPLEPREHPPRLRSRHEFGAEREETNDGTRVPRFVVPVSNGIAWIVDNVRGDFTVASSSKRLTAFDVKKMPYGE